MICWISVISFANLKCAWKFELAISLPAHILVRTKTKWTFNYSSVETNEQTSHFYCETLFVIESDGTSDKYKIFEFNKMGKWHGDVEAQQITRMWSTTIFNGTRRFTSRCGIFTSCVFYEQIAWYNCIRWDATTELSLTCHFFAILTMLCVIRLIVKTEECDAAL